MAAGKAKLTPCQFENKPKIIKGTGHSSATSDYVYSTYTSRVALFLKAEEAVATTSKHELCVCDL